MSKSASSLILLLAAAALAGCVTSEPDADEEVLAPLVDGSGRTITDIEVPFGEADAGSAAIFMVHAAAGAVSSVSSPDTAGHVTLPGNFWTVVEGSSADKMKLVPPSADGAYLTAAGEELRFLVPPFTESFEITVHVEGADALDVTVAAPWSANASLVNGERVLELMEVQESDFPNRQPGQPSYQAFQDYAEQFFRDAGYTDVRNDPYDFDEFPDLPVGPEPSVFANVVAYRPGTGMPDRIMGFGGHYDMVPNTKHAAFDDTSGTIATMVLAETFAQFETDVGLLFGLWGGEESGILGSQFFVRSNPDIVAQMVTYVNLDVISLAWPGPFERPDPIVVSAGPDGVIADDMLAQGAYLYRNYVPEMPQELLRLEPVAEGQACGTSSSQQDQCDGSGVNAQSDHTPFIAAGVPSIFVFDGNISNVFRFIHNQGDTLYNMTWYMGTGEILDRGTLDGENPFMTSEQEAIGRELLAQSFESMMTFGWYYAHEVDHGMYAPPGR